MSGTTRAATSKRSSARPAPAGKGVRLLHTSDWHIGRRFHQVDLLDDQRRFGDWLVEVVRDQAIDAVLVAGDLFDRSTPAADAVDLLDDIFLRVLDHGTSVVAISGNHDSAQRLHFGSRAMRGAGLHLCTERPSLHSGAPITITGRAGDTVEVVALPYLDPYRVLDTHGADRTHDAVLRAALAHQLGEVGDPGRTIVMAHTFVAGGSATDSERELSVGGSSATGLDMFDDVGYVALGHLHRPQSFLDDRVAYSGSPLAYSFTEEHTKSVRIVDCADIITVTSLPIDVGRPVRTLRGTLAELLDSRTFNDVGDAWVRAELADTSVQLGALDQLRARFPNVVEVQQAGLQRQAQFTNQEVGEVRNPTHIIASYLDETFPDLPDDERVLVDAAINTVLREHP